jgi:hypothetical protein
LVTIVRIGSDRVGGEVVDAPTGRVTAGVTRQRVEPQQHGPAARSCQIDAEAGGVQSTAMIASKVRMTLKTRAASKRYRWVFSFL